MTLPRFDQIRPKIEQHIREVKDFPKKGINFRDIMPLFTNPQLVNELCVVIADHVRHTVGHVDSVAGLEARGFLFGPQVAIQLGVPFVPIRKKGKLPGATIEASYVKEYGEDRVEIQEGAIKNGDIVFLIDDLLATGGTLRAATDLVVKAGGKVGEAFVLIELAPLNGRSKLPDVNLTTLISYDSA
ncbi:Adenine phosphoribosyltransferase [Caenorhabditis elegans]|uniref:Adenine phosphoribosyltransferase n=2 Tax=Caenorhabditis elegans TaxID=6239 RepID=APT_CAEEL|nr:Adenine phosphoribosyltransferase [Caenorhabditis elegans]P91455.1 RecName: Full=Adenine phosphoribosyltransferase; Short=APRT [Caenorhabditis elegans]AAG50224.1 adenine phosphoribosyltransferase [Caenorhabditis elegans]CCD62975.1 Adenine phosphoribosyltransferase [Caenorhabditis elegans]|eukprot:NP_491663.1 Adenine phosphoribosyltransferase [Caenorhabditis elegans]